VGRFSSFIEEANTFTEEGEPKSKFASLIDEARSFTEEAQERTPPLRTEELLPLLDLTKRFAAPQVKGIEMLPGVQGPLMRAGAGALDLIGTGLSTGAGLAQRGIRTLKGEEPELPLGEELKGSVRERKHLGEVIFEETPSAAAPGEPGFVASEMLRGVSADILGILGESLGLAGLARGGQLLTSPVARLEASQARNLKVLDKLAKSIEGVIPEDIRNFASQRGVNLSRSMASKIVLEGGEGGAPLSNRAAKRIADQIRKGNIALQLEKEVRRPPALLTEGAVPKKGQFARGTKYAKALARKGRAKQGFKSKGVVEAGPVEGAIADEVRRQLPKLSPPQQAVLLDILKSPTKVPREISIEIPEQILRARMEIRPPFHMPQTKTEIPRLEKKKATVADIVNHITEHVSLDDLKSVTSALFVERPDVIFSTSHLAAIQEGLKSLDRPGKFVV
jgi:hypothetical protein